MIEKFGIGIDISDVEEFRKILFSKKPNFYKKIFLDSEIKYCLSYKDPYEHFAGKFAIKEAVIKSIREKISFLDIKTSHKLLKPQVSLTKKLPYKFIVSLSHDRNLAIAVVISEKQK